MARKITREQLMYRISQALMIAIAIWFLAATCPYFFKQAPIEYKTHPYPSDEKSPYTKSEIETKDQGHGTKY